MLFDISKKNDRYNLSLELYETGIKSDSEKGR